MAFSENSLTYLLPNRCKLRLLRAFFLNQSFAVMIGRVLLLGLLACLNSVCHVSAESTAGTTSAAVETTAAPTTTTTMSEAEKVPVDRATIRTLQGVVLTKSNGYKVFNSSLIT